MDSKKTGALVSTLRKEKGMTQKELAAQLHVSDRTVSKWERGAGFPDVSLMMQLADTLGISVNELLQGERRQAQLFCAETETEVRDAVVSLDRHTRAREKQACRRLIAGGLILVLLLLGVWRLVYRLGETQILFPPQIHCEILQNDVPVTAELTVDRSNSGVYDYVCNYEVDVYGNITLRDRKLWQSYTDVVEEETYRTLRKLHTGTLTSVDRLENGGFLARYDEGPASCTLVETDADGSPMFSYEIDAERYTVACEAALVTEQKLYFVSKSSEEERLYITTVDKASGTETVCEFVYADLADDSDSKNGRDSENVDGSVGGFLFDKDHMWVQDDVLYFAETYYGEDGCRAVVGFFDLRTQQARTVWSKARAQVVTVRHDAENGTVSVMVNPMDNAPLEVVVMDDCTLERVRTVQLVPPHEYLAQKGSVYAVASYLLYAGDMNAQHAAVLFDVTTRQQAEAGVRSDMLAIYEAYTGQMVWRGRFEMDSDYTICGVRLGGEVL